MKKTAKKIASMLALFALCITLGLCALACGGTNDPPPKAKPVAPVKVSDGTDIDVAAGKSKNLTVADYITVNDYSPSAESDSENATATIAQGLLTVTGVSEGDATVTLSCGDITVTFGVTVFTEYSVTVDGVANYVKKGGTFNLPPAPAIDDADFEFDYWLVNGGEYENAHKDPDDELTVNSNITVTAETKRKAAVKVKEGGDVTVSFGKNKSLDVADYITTHGRTVSEQSQDEAVATAALSEGKLTITAVAVGNTTVTLTCGEITVTFNVTISAAPLATYTVTVDGAVVATVDDGDTYTLPPAVASSDPNFEFAGWKVDGGEVKQPGEEIPVEDDVVIIADFKRKAVEKVKDGIAVNLSVDGTTSSEITVSDYVASYGRTVSAQSNNEAVATASLDAGTLTITAVAVGKTTVTLACDGVTVTFTVNVRSADDNAPVFANDEITFDLFENTSGSCTFKITEPEGTNYTYEYTVTPDTGVSVSGNTLTYTATAAVSNLVLNVAVTATDSVLGTTTTEFSVTVNVTDTTPTVIENKITILDTKDLHDGALKINLAENVKNAANVASYKVNGSEVDGTEYEVTGSYTDTAQAVELTVEAVISAEKSVTYTYTVNVIDTTAYRLTNGGFDNGLDGWTLSNPDLGAVNNATHYWAERVEYKADGAFFNAYTNLLNTKPENDPPPEYDPTVTVSGNEGATGTLTSSTFKVGGSGWMTYKLGGAKNKDAVYIEVVRVSDNKAVKLLNYDWSDVEMHGCQLVAYKVNLIDYCGFAKGDDVFVRVTDNATGDYGLFFLDSVVTYYTEEPGSEYSIISDYRLYNGGFEVTNAGGIANWTVDGGDIGVITDSERYWIHSDNLPYNKDGKLLFSWWSWEGNLPSEANPGYEINRETQTGTLTSGEFILKAGQTISFKFAGGHANQHDIYIEVVDAETNSAIAKFYNTHADRGTLIQYHYTFNTDTDKACYIRVVDNATGDWGCFAVDSFITYGNVVTTGIEAINQLTV